MTVCIQGHQNVCNVKLQYALLASPSSHITLKFVDVQMQLGIYDCGLFAVAFATTLVYG